jgi:inhibitor of cysteine peptidase
MTIEISDSETSASRTLMRDEEVVVRLSENPTTGYRWQLTQSGTGELGLVDDRFVGGAEGAAPGAAGVRLIRFIARRPGAVKVEAVLRRAWDPPGASAQTRVFAIAVH